VKLVIDTNILVSAFLWKGAVNRFIALVEESDIQVYTSRVLLDELESTLQSEKLTRAVHASGLDVSGLMSRYRDMSTLITTRQMTQQICRDADDDAVLACALAARADMIVTGDKDLLVLQPFQGVDILNPTDALQRLAQHP